MSFPPRLLPLSAELDGLTVRAAHQRLAGLRQGGWRGEACWLPVPGREGLWDLVLQDAPAAGLAALLAEEPAEAASG